MTGGACAFDRSARDLRRSCTWLKVSIGTTGSWSAFRTIPSHRRKPAYTGLWRIRYTLIGVHAVPRFVRRPFSFRSAAVSSSVRPSRRSEEHTSELQSPDHL